MHEIILIKDVDYALEIAIKVRFTEDEIVDVSLMYIGRFSSIEEIFPQSEIEKACWRHLCKLNHS